MGNHRAERAPKRRTSAEAPPNGRRRATTPPRRSVLRSVPSLPLVAGVAVLAISAGGAITASEAGVTALTSSGSSLDAAGSISSAAGQALSRRGVVVSRDVTRSTGEETDPELVALAEQQMVEREAKLAEYRKAAEKQAAKIKENKWVLPMADYEITATYGEYGLWANYHTGLDFNGETGDPIMSIANGTVTLTGYDSAYGNRTVVTLDDGTEIWYCHQSAIYVSVGDRVYASDVIGAVGATGNVTGSHLHLEVRPGGGDPVDPFQAFVEHGIVP